ncbi:MAG: hypothetical protein AB7F43_12195 [Bacteriovoracia bacterium]
MFKLVFGLFIFLFPVISFSNPVSNWEHSLRLHGDLPFRSLFEPLHKSSTTTLLDEFPGALLSTYETLKAAFKTRNPNAPFLLDSMKSNEAKTIFFFNTAAGKGKSAYLRECADAVKSATIKNPSLVRFRATWKKAEDPWTINPLVLLPRELQIEVLTKLQQSLQQRPQTPVTKKVLALIPTLLACAQNTWFSLDGTPPKRKPIPVFLEVEKQLVIDFLEQASSKVHDALYPAIEVYERRLQLYYDSNSNLETLWPRYLEDKKTYCNLDPTSTISKIYHNEAVDDLYRKAYYEFPVSRETFLRVFDQHIKFVPVLAPSNEVN